MCGQNRFDVRDNVATFDGQVEVGCLPMMGITPTGSDVADQLRAHMTAVLCAHLRNEKYRTGEGRVTVTAHGMWCRVRATLFAEGPDADLVMPTYLWDRRAARRSAGS